MDSSYGCDLSIISSRSGLAMPPNTNASFGWSSDEGFREYVRVASVLVRRVDRELVLGVIFVGIVLPSVVHPRHVYICRELSKKRAVPTVPKSYFWNSCADPRFCVRVVELLHKTKRTRPGPACPSPKRRTRPAAPPYAEPAVLAAVAAAEAAVTAEAAAAEAAFKSETAKKRR
eukprot:SAG11_NODE_2528_length_3253_cov_13.746988_3_plen_174_part_00